jgi:hypothetical protein
VPTGNHSHSQVAITHLNVSERGADGDPVTPSENPGWRHLTGDLICERPGDTALLRRLATRMGIVLPFDYVEFMALSDGGAGNVGDGYLEIWDTTGVASIASDNPTRYGDLLLFAGDGANTVYGFESVTSDILEGDWIGLARDELMPRGRTLTDLLIHIARG